MPRNIGPRRQLWKKKKEKKINQQQFNEICTNEFGAVRVSEGGAKKALTAENGQQFFYFCS